MDKQPFVSVLTPVYNGEPYLAECIQSILAQDYTNWEYVIVNNCSTDGTLAVAENYAARDSRIRVVTNKVFVNVADNHNNAFREIALHSQYSKVLSADDRLLPESLGKMVRFAVEHPRVGIVGALQRSGGDIKFKGFPEDMSVLSGREACRLVLQKGVHVFGSPTAVLYRSDLVRRKVSFFPNSEPYADTSVFYAYLTDCDFGFIHEVLSVERVHVGQVSARLQKLGASYPAYMETLIQYGPLYLSDTELEARREELLASYYQMLGCNMLKMAGPKFWEFHKQKLSAMGYTVNWNRVLIEAVRELGSELKYPVKALRKFKLALEARHSL